MFRPKYYMGIIVGITENFQIENNDVENSIFEAKKHYYGTFIFKRCFGGYKEILTNKTFKYVAHIYASDTSCYVAPKDTGIMVDANSISVIEDRDCILNAYKLKYNINELNLYFLEAENRCNTYLKSAYRKAFLHNKAKRKLLK